MNKVLRTRLWNMRTVKVAGADGFLTAYNLPTRLWDASGRTFYLTHNSIGFPQCGQVTVPFSVCGFSRLVLCTHHRAWYSRSSQYCRQSGLTQIHIFQTYPQVRQEYVALAQSTVTNLRQGHNILHSHLSPERRRFRPLCSQCQLRHPARHVGENTPVLTGRLQHITS